MGHATALSPSAVLSSAALRYNPHTSLGACARRPTSSSSPPRPSSPATGAPRRKTRRGLVRGMRSRLCLRLSLQAHPSVPSGLECLCCSRRIAGCDHSIGAICGICGSAPRPRRELDCSLGRPHGPDHFSTISITIPNGSSEYSALSAGNSRTILQPCSIRYSLAR